MIEIIKNNWFQFFQTVGIVGSLLLTSYTAITQTRARRLTNYLEITKGHRDLWKMSFDHDFVNNIFDDDIDHPIQVNEQNRFIGLIFLHLSCAYEFSKLDNIINIEKMSFDVGEFAQNKKVIDFWTENKKYHNSDFIEFVDTSITSYSKKSYIPFWQR